MANETSAEKLLEEYKNNLQMFQKLVWLCT